MTLLTFPKYRIEYPINIDRPLDDMIRERKEKERKERQAKKAQMESLGDKNNLQKAPASAVDDQSPYLSSLRKRKRVSGSWSAQKANVDDRAKKSRS